MRKTLCCVGALALTLSAFSATTLRLVYGKDWCPAGAAVRAMLESAAFKSAAGADYTVEIVDEEGTKAAAGNLGSIELPAIFAIDAEGHCLRMLENVPYNETPADLLAKVRAAESAAADKTAAMATVDGCGRFLQKMERYDRGPRRVIEKPCFPEVFAQLQKLDPQDASGWQRHFTFGSDIDKWNKADGLEFVIKANDYREKKDFAGGEAFVKHQEELPDAHLTTEQKQSILMARFALYREDAARKNALIALLRRVKAMDPTTLWGTAAIGWLDWWGVEKAPAKVVENPCKSRGTSGVRGASALPEGNVVVARYIRRLIGEKTLDAIAAKEGGTDFLRRFFGDEAWMDEFAGSGPWCGSPWRDRNDTRTDGDLAAAALKALDLLFWNDKAGFMLTPLGRNIATALALDHGADWDDAKLVAVMRDYRRWAQDGTLITESLTQDTHAWREVLAFGQNAGLPEENLVWMHNFAFLPPPRYCDLCWCCAYRVFNCFGQDVQGPDYYRPWEWSWGTQELRYRVGGVCGALSKFGSHGAASHGIRSFTAGQPGHCAYIVWDYEKNRWNGAYFVTAHTQPHFTLGGRGFAALEEQERYFANPRRMEAERLRWEGRYMESVRLVPGNYQAADEWRRALAADPSTTLADWRRYGNAVLAGFATAPSEGWNLYFTAIEHRPAGERLMAAVRGLQMMRENAADTIEHPYFDEIALNPLWESFRDDKAALWTLLEAALAGQAHTPSFYRQVIDWGAAKLMDNPADAQRFLAVVGRSAEETGEKLDFAQMVRKASESGDNALFEQVYRLAARLDPKSLPKEKSREWPREAFGHPLVGEKALVQISSTSGWDKPLNYRELVLAREADYDNAFHTSSETAPWVTLKLAGETEVSGLTIVNSGAWQNGGRQVPLAAWVSADGKTWQQVWSTDTREDVWQVPLKSGLKAKYVRVGRVPGAKKDFFHLHKVLVYGRKLY